MIKYIKFWCRHRDVAPRGATSLPENWLIQAARGGPGHRTLVLRTEVNVTVLEHGNVNACRVNVRTYPSDLSCPRVMPQGVGL